MLLPRRFTPMFALIAAVVLLLPASAVATPTLSALAPTKVTAGAASVATGTVTPVAAGELVQLEQIVDGAWTKQGSLAATDAAGKWRVTFIPATGGQVRATQLSGTGGSSDELSIQVAPRVTSAALARGTVYPFLGAKATWRLATTTYPDGPVTIALTIDRRAAGTVRARVKRGVVRATLPTRGVGRFSATLKLPARDGFEAANAAPLVFAVRGARVGSGSSATWNRALRAGLAFRGIYVPGGSRFDSHMGDSVIAFHKAYRRARTTTFEASDWKRLTRAKISPRYRGAGLHIEVDKGRQLLMQVNDGVVTMAVHVSTGVTGNTPVGRHSILWKGNWVPSNYGSLLFKSMAFSGGYAIHGYPSVPTTPASHGCVRVPMWIAAKLYSRSPVGTPVYVYEGPGGTATSIGRDAARDTPELAGVAASRWADEATATA